MFNKKKKKQKSDDKPEINKEDTFAEIIIFREQEGSAKEIMNFFATQKGEDGLNLVLENKDANFKEEVAFIENELIGSIRNRLKLQGMSVKKQVETITERIEVQNQIISEMKQKNFKEVEKLKKSNGELSEAEIKKYEAKGLDRRYNTIDEEVKLKKLEDLLYVVENDGKGFFEFSNIKNQRKYFYTYLDGHVFPIKYVSAKRTMYVGKTKKVKNYRSEQVLIDKKRDQRLNGFTDWAKIALNALLVILLIVNIFWSQQNFKDRKNVDDIISEQVNAEREFWRNKCSTESIDLEKECKQYIDVNTVPVNVNSNQLQRVEAVN